MTDEQHQQLSQTHPALAVTVLDLVTRGVDRDQAWLLAGALIAYTGIASIPQDILHAAGKQKTDYPKVVGQVNDVLRGRMASSGALDNLVELLKGIEEMPDWLQGDNDPTRMMDAYPGIEKDYKVGNVVIMAEVGSVSRNRPDRGLYAKQYRLHFQGGLKDISHINPAQQEVIYAPGSAYLVTQWRTGKVKHKKGDQAHEHIYLQYVSRDSKEFKQASSTGHVVDKREKRFRGVLPPSHSEADSSGSVL
jgi:hypothetical protein